MSLEKEMKEIKSVSRKGSVKKVVGEVITLKDNKNLYKKENEEYYNVIRTNITFLGEENKVIAVTSTKENEGKTTTALNISISLANSGYKVLFVDADLRHSILSGKIKYRKKIDGLTKYLSGQAESKKIELKTDIDNLDIVPAGYIPLNATLLLENKKFEDLIKKARKNYDYVIVDTPPIGIVIDAFVIAQKCDGVIYLAESGRIKKKEILKNKELIEKTNAKYLGIILTKHKFEKQEYGYGYGYGYQVTEEG